MSTSELCSFDNCDKPRRTLGFCVGHYRQHHEGETLRPLRASGGEWGSWRKHTAKGYIIRTRNVPGEKRDVQFQHRFVVEKARGFPLLPHEEVHHLNGQRDDNRLENLEVWSTSQPKGQRVEDKIAWMVEFLADYGYTVE